MKSLFAYARKCVVCGGEAPHNQKPFGKDQLSILGLNVTIYRRTRVGRQLATSKGVQVCEPCVARIGAGGSTATREGRRLCDALLAVILERYRRMVEGDQLAVDSRERFKQLFRGASK